MNLPVADEFVHLVRALLTPAGKQLKSRALPRWRYENLDEVEDSLLKNCRYKQH